MDPRLASHCKVLGLNSRLLRNCLAGVDDAKARTRLGGHTNNMAFLALHLEDARHTLCRTRLDATTFLVHHESFHLGQRGLLRRALGLPPMSYAEDELQS